jgi:hypothetical protein
VAKSSNYQFYTMYNQHYTIVLFYSFNFKRGHTLVLNCELFIPIWMYLFLSSFFRVFFNGIKCNTFLFINVGVRTNLRVP